jgi:hypothetical protein
MLIKFLKPTRICKKIKAKSNAVGNIHGGAFADKR